LSMGTLLVKNIHTLVTMDEQRREFHDVAMFVQNGIIAAVGMLRDMPSQTADMILDGTNRIVVPGLVNTHHHMYQSLTRVLAQNDQLFGWLKKLYPIWSRLTGEMVYVSAKLAMAELILCGCTTSSDHLYIFPNDVKLDDEIRAAQEIGIRFHATRGSMCLGESRGGLPPDVVVEEENAILSDTRRLIEQYHDAEPYAMVRVAVAPCSPFSVTRDLMREAAVLARSYGVRLHTHLAENDNDVTYSMEQFGYRPGDYAEDVGWVGQDVWHAHCVKLDPNQISLFGRTGTRVCHCPSSNMRLASGIAPVRAMLDAGVGVGLGVDGSASNDSGNLLAEARQAMLLQRVHGNPAALSAREALEIATRGGATALGRDDIGALAPGMAADFAAFRLDSIGFAGGLHDAAAALLFCSPVQADFVVIQGRVVVQHGHLLTDDLPLLIERHNKLSRQLIDGD
jgi:cytosine/adenosine deaminase-related metal-dependent hydrolase